MSDTSATTAATGTGTGTGPSSFLGVTVSRLGFIRFQLGAITAMIALCLFHYIYTEAAGKDMLSYATGIFDAGRENSIPTWFSILNLLLASGFLFLIAHHEKLIGAPLARRWFVLAVIILLLSMDEGASLHERLQKTQQYTGVLIPMIESHPWVLYGAVFATGVFLYFISFLRKVGPRLAGMFLLSGGIFLAGALGFETMGAWFVHNDIAVRGDILYMLRRAAEEACEMYGIALFNIVLFGEIQRRGIGLTLALRD